MVDENTSLLSSGGSKDNGATRRRSKLGSFSRFGGELFHTKKKISFSPVMCTFCYLWLTDIPFMYISALLSLANRFTIHVYIYDIYANTTSYIYT